MSFKLCRLCGKEKLEGVDVFTDKMRGAVLVSIINKYFPKEVMNISTSDNFSKYVCIDCEQKICNFDEFFLMVANVQKQLTAPSLEIDFAEDMLCHLKENELSLEKNSGNKCLLQKKFVCDQCSKNFRCQAHLDRHKRIHTGYRPFICNVCSMSFNQAEILKIHQKSHQKQKGFKCENCLQSFRFKVSLKSHLLNFHSEKNDNATSGLQFNKSLSCPECGKIFATKYKFQRHIRCHTGEKPFTCNYCHRNFSQTGNLKLHLIKCSRSSANRIIPDIQQTIQVLDKTKLSQEQIDSSKKLLIPDNSKNSNHTDVDTDKTNRPIEHFSQPPCNYLSETEMQDTFNQTFNSTTIIDSCTSPYLEKNFSNTIYIDAEEIETILERDLPHLNTTPTPNSTFVLNNKYFSSIPEDKVPLCIKQPETPELFHSLLYDV
ncbi:zinc finger and BTB domain-containing protein 49-like [Chelonus insularis]|uniref:zinc finger and BTB domain-containing protein 49-like n=1 Tax=Chelonus insularis TaxID=460826 RepID=UPI00158C922E|nr:zinc finger and BTB domain-containing protein 49-like [Chelonus insularis]